MRHFSLKAACLLVRKWSEKKKQQQQQQKNATSVFHARQKWSGQMLITLTFVCALNISVPPPSPSPKSVKPSSDYEARQHHHWIRRGMEDVPIYLSSIIGEPFLRKEWAASTDFQTTPCVTKSTFLQMLATFFILVMMHVRDFFARCSSSLRCNQVPAE